MITAVVIYEDNRGATRIEGPYTPEMARAICRFLLDTPRAVEWAGVVNAMDYPEKGRAA